MSAGQYIRRAAGYFIKLVVLVGLLYLLMFVTGTARVSAEFFFRELFTTPRGILLVAALAVLSAFYPKFGYVSREAEADIVADRDAIINAFHAAGYVMVDDRVTMRTFGGGIVIEGIRKEAVHAQFRINTYIQNRSYGKRD